MNDVDSAENVSKQIGKYTREQRSHSTKDGALVFGGTSSYSMEGTELISAQDILNISDKEVIILVSGHKAKPLKLLAAPYYNDKNAVKKLKWKFDPTNGKKQDVKEAEQPIKQSQTANEADPTPENIQVKSVQSPTNNQVQESSTPSAPTPSPTTQNTIEPTPSPEEKQATKEADEARALYEFE